MFKKLITRLRTQDPEAREKNKNTWVTAIISFLIAVTLWFVVTLNNKTYQTLIDYPVKVINIPNQVQLRSDLPSFMTVNAQGSGIDLLWELMSGGRDTILIDFQRHAQNEYFYAASHLSTINAALPPDVQALSAKPDTLRLKYKNRSHKWVPVVSRAEINFRDAYRPVKEIGIFPDTVLVIGPEEELAQIRFWPTSAITTEEIYQPTNLVVPLDTIDPFQVIPDNVQLNIDAEPFTEAVQEVSVSIKNQTLQTRLKLFPAKVKVRYLVPLDRFDQITADSIKLEIDLKTINRNSPYLLPRVTYQSSFITINGMEPAYLTYQIQELP